jgi:hypothetical protein
MEADIQIHYRQQRAYKSLLRVRVCGHGSRQSSPVFSKMTTQTSEVKKSVETTRSNERERSRTTGLSACIHGAKAAQRRERP